MLDFAVEQLSQKLEFVALTKTQLALGGNTVLDSMLVEHD